MKFNKFIYLTLSILSLNISLFGMGLDSNELVERIKELKKELKANFEHSYQLSAELGDLKNRFYYENEEELYESISIKEEELDNIEKRQFHLPSEIHKLERALFCPNLNRILSDRNMSSSSIIEDNESNNESNQEDRYDISTESNNRINDLNNRMNQQADDISNLNEWKKFHSSEFTEFVDHVSGRMNRFCDRINQQADDIHMINQNVNSTNQSSFNFYGASPEEFPSLALATPLERSSESDAGLTHSSVSISNASSSNKKIYGIAAIAVVMGVGIASYKKVYNYIKTKFYKQKSSKSKNNIKKIALKNK